MASQLERLTFDLAINNVVLTDAINEIDVDLAMRLPDMATLSLYVDDIDLGVLTKFEIGQSLEIKIGLDGSGGTLFKGEVTGLEPDFERSGRTTLIVRAYDKSYRLHRGKKSRTFVKQSDSDIIKTMAKEAGLSLGTIDVPKEVTHAFMLQYNQTDMEWLLMRAEQLGCQVFIAKAELNFVPSVKKTGSPVELTWGDNLLSFRPRISAVHQPKKVSVHSWNQLQKQEIVGSAESNAALKSPPFNKPGGSFVSSALRDNTEVAIVNIPVQDVNAANGIAAGYMDDMDGSFAQAEGIAFGNEDIQVGRPVDIKIREQKLTDYSGEYVVSAVRHVYRRTGRWETHFSVSGRRSNLLSNFLGGSNNQDLYGNRFNGVVSAIVTNFVDPENLGRIKVKYPWLISEKGQPIESDWVRIAAPGAGDKRGFYFIPEVEDEVLIAFEHGDPNRPYMIGALWNQKDPTPKPTNQVNDGSVINERIIKSRSGHIIVLKDTSGQEQILIQDKTGQNEVMIDTKTNSVNIKADKDINIVAKGNVNIKAGGAINTDSKANTNMRVETNFVMEAKANAVLKSGSSMSLETQGGLKAKGLSTEVSGELKADLKSTGMITVQGALIKLN